MKLTSWSSSVLVNGLVMAQGLSQQQEDGQHVCGSKNICAILILESCYRLDGTEIMPGNPGLRRSYPPYHVIATRRAKSNFMSTSRGTYNYQYSLRPLEGTAGIARTGRTITGIRAPRQPKTVIDLSLLCKGTGQRLERFVCCS